MVIVVILAFTIIAALQIPPLIKKKYIKELVVFSIFLLSGFIFMLFLTSGVELPNPVDAMISLFDVLNWHF